MDKQYVIINMKGWYCRFLEKKLIMFTPYIKDAQFFDSEMLAYEFINDFKHMFSERKKNMFFEIRCVVIIYKEEIITDKSKADLSDYEY